jgi:hypothetical protein
MTTEPESTAENTGNNAEYLGSVPFWTVVVVGVICAMVGFGGGFFVTRGKKE